MSDCSKHKKDLFGEADMKKAARVIADMHYESLCELLLHLSQSLLEDSQKDGYDGKAQLSKSLDYAGDFIYDAHISLIDAWKISKPFMEQKPKTND